MRLNQLIKAQEIKAPEGVVFTIKGDLSWSEHVEMQEIPEDSERGLYSLSKMIIAWNIEGEDEKVLPINVDNIKKLPAAIIEPAMNTISEIFASHSKKKVNSPKS